MIGRQYAAMRLKKVAEDPAYGYSEKLAIKVGGGFGKGSENTYRFLNALRGPDGQVVHYKRLGSCCQFKTENSPLGDTGLLEVYEISYEGGKPVELYFNWYESEKPMVPVGLSAGR